MLTKSGTFRSCFQSWFPSRYYPLRQSDANYSSVPTRLIVFLSLFSVGRPACAGDAWKILYPESISTINREVPGLVSCTFRGPRVSTKYPIVPLVPVFPSSMLIFPLLASSQKGLLFGYHLAFRHPSHIRQPIECDLTSNHS